MRSASLEGEGKNIRHHPAVRLARADILPTHMTVS
jgi:hypothetical protein